MRNIILFTALSLFSSVNLFAQKSDITQEYFLLPLLKEFRAEFRAEFPYVKPEINEELVNKSLVRSEKDCSYCFYYNDESSDPTNKYKINFKDYISVDNYKLAEDAYNNNYAFWFIGPSRFKDFNSFRKQEKSRLKEAGIKKKAEQEIVFNKLISKRQELGTLLAKYYHNYDYEVQFRKTLKNRYPELFSRSSYPSEKQEKLLLEKISPYFNSLDNLLISPRYSTKKNTVEENEMLKNKLIEEGLVEITEWAAKSSDGYTFIFPKFNNKLSDRSKTLRRYFNLTQRFEARWSFAKQRLLNLLYGNLGNAFALENFLEVCGTNVPSKEDFIKDENKLKDLIKEYVSVLNGRVGANIKGYDKTLKKYPKEILYHNVVNNHYGIQDGNLAQIRKQQADLLEKEQSEKGGILRRKDYYKVTKQGKFDLLSFGFNLSLTREINQSDYFGSYEEKSNNIYKIVLIDDKTDIKIPVFEARVSSDGKKLYLGGDKVPYKLYDSREANCLKNRDGVWESIDGKESFSTDGIPTWESSITGGIKTKGSLYKISSNKYAYVIYDTSWRGKLDNTLVIITTSNNCNTIYYGKGKKKMVLVK